MGEATPTPWVYMAGCIYSEAPGYKAKLHRGKVAEVSIAWKDSAERDANARRIIIAVNAHDDLVAALQMVVDGPHDTEAIADMLPKLRAALAKAQGQ